MRLNDIFYFLNASYVDIDKAKCKCKGNFFSMRFSKGNHFFRKFSTRRHSGAFLSSLEIDRSRCGAIYSGVVSFSSFVPNFPSLGMRRTVYHIFLLLRVMIQKNVRQYDISNKQINQFE